LDQNLIQLIATFKTGNTKTNFNGETEDYQEYSNSAFEVDDSSYWYYFHYSYDFENEVANHNELKRISEVRLDLRWQKEINNEEKFNTFVEFTKSSYDLSGTKLESWQWLSKDSFCERWRNYPNIESTQLTVVDTQAYYVQSLAIGGTGEKRKGIIGFGYETPLTNNLQGFVGIKSLFSSEKDSSQERAIIDSISPPGSYTYSVRKKQQGDLFLLFGLEYSVLPSIRIQSGITPKLLYEKTSSKDEWRIYSDIINKDINIFYSFGVGFKLGPKLTLDTYNTGNLVNIKEWVCSTQI